jgi:hypothetical protein
MSGPGVFTLSLDTELAWGSFDKDGVERYGDAYRETQTVVNRLCALFDDYEVPATWAFVAHLFADCDGHAGGEMVGDTARADWLASAPCSTGVDRSLWYAPELLATVLDCETPQDVGLHGYSHLVLGDHAREAADAELRDAVAAARDAGLDPSSFVYPRNHIAHVDLLGEYGIDVFRGVDARWYEQAPLGAGRKPLRFLDEATIRPPPAVTPTEREGVVCVPGSQVFRPERGPWAWTPTESQTQRAHKGLDRAVETGGVFHLWWHPFNLAGNLDHHLNLLEDILTYVDTLRGDDDIELMSMKDVADAYRDGRWQQERRGVT